MKSFWESPRQLCVLKRTTQVLKSTCKLVVVRKAFFGERVDPRWIDLLSRQLQFQQMEQVFFLIGSVELLHEFWLISGVWLAVLAEAVLPAPFFAAFSRQPARTSVPVRANRSHPPARHPAWPASFP